jgi:hypothetical protein
MARLVSLALDRSLPKKSACNPVFPSSSVDLTGTNADKTGKYRCRPKRPELRRLTGETSFHPLNGLKIGMKTVERPAP